MSAPDSKEDDVLELDPEDFEWEEPEIVTAQSSETNEWVLVEDPLQIDPSRDGWAIEISMVSSGMSIEQRRLAYEDFRRLESLQKNGIAQVVYDRETGIVRMNYMKGCALRQFPRAVFDIMAKYPTGIGAYRSAIRIPDMKPERSIKEVVIGSIAPSATETVKDESTVSRVKEDPKVAILRSGKFSTIDLQLPYDVDKDGVNNPRTGKKNLPANKHALNSKIFSDVVLKIASKEGLSATIMLLSKGKITLKKKNPKSGGLSDESIAALMDYIVEVE